MKILIVVSYFYPEVGSAAHIYFDLAKQFSEDGHEVHVLTSYPRPFNLIEKDRTITFPLEEQHKSIYIHRVKYNTKRDSLLMRGLEHYNLPRIYYKKYKKMNIKFDICLIYIPPLPLINFAKNIKKRDGTLSVLNFQDFHPQELTDVGVLTNPVIIKTMLSLEKRAYLDSDHIVVISKGGKNYILNKSGRQNGITSIFNGIRIGIVDEALSEANFKSKMGIMNKILISYAGILSPFQGLDNILDAAKEIKDESVIFFLVGDGMEKNRLEQRICEENILSVRILPLQSRNDYFNIIGSSDISIVSLDERMKAPCLPGKIPNLLAAKQPIIAIVSEDSETSRVIKEANCGLVVRPGNKKKLIEVIEWLIKEEQVRRSMGESGRSYLENNMNVIKTAQQFEILFEEQLEHRRI
jgi:colanic acid biosynthesis glycosyl transferase WcaI